MLSLHVFGRKQESEKLVSYCRSQTNLQFLKFIAFKKGSLLYELYSSVLLASEYEWLDLIFLQTLVGKI